VWTFNSLRAERLAADFETSKAEIDTLAAFFERSRGPGSN
jgi:hypothetical protein